MTKRTAAEQVAGNQYLLEEILMRLPAKSVTRSKLVSKQWHAHISTTQFVQLHSQHRPNRLHTGMFVTDFRCDCRDADFIAFNDDLNPSYQLIPSLGFLYDGMKHLDESDWIRILESCNGLLLLCVVSWKWNSSSLLCSNYCVCNPTTMTITFLPIGPFQCPSISNKAYLAFDPCVSPHYKVVICDSHLLYIYSSENQSWKTVQSPSKPFGQGFFSNGSIYWLPPLETSSFCFDVYNEEMKQLRLPLKTPPCRWSHLATVGSHLYYLEWNTGLTLNFRLHEMTRDSSEWVIKYDACMSPLLSAFPEIEQFFEWEDHVLKDYCFSEICVVEGVREDEAQLMLGIPGKLILYNFKEKTAKELHTFQGRPDDGLWYRSAGVFQFVESLYVV